MKQYTFIQLNEINFEIVGKYIKKGYHLPFLEKIILTGIDTYEDEIYENLEPWIQWFTIFKGEPYKLHGIFRLGDGLNQPGDNLFSDIRNTLNMSCGAIAPMNIPAGDIDFDFFLPDPWSNQIFKGKRGLDFIYKAIKQGVNDNSGKGLNFKNKIFLLLGLLLNLNLIDLLKALKYFLKINGLSYRKALFLDLILTILHQRLIKRYKTQFSSVFLNAGAHIQHHYLLNSKVLSEKNKFKNPNWYINQNKDPLAEALILYDRILNSYYKLGFEIIIMTGLQQVPYDRAIFYYRLSNHSLFLDYLEISYVKIFTRMTRDFEIIFESNIDRDICRNKLSKIIDENGIRVFDELDTRNKSIFCTLTYPNEILPSQIFLNDKNKFNLFNFVNFVGIKNGQHHKQGKLFFSSKNLQEIYCKSIELSDVREIILSELRVNN